MKYHKPLPWKAFTEPPSFPAALHWNTSEVVLECCDFRVSLRVLLKTPPMLLEWESLCLSVDLDSRTYTFKHRQQQATGELPTMAGSCALLG